MPRPPLTTEKPPLIDTASHLLAEDGSGLLATNPPIPVKRKEAPLVS